MKIGIPYYGISSGKLRRYFDIKNFTDPFKVLKGYQEATTIIITGLFAVNPQNSKPLILFPAKSSFRIGVPVTLF